MPPESILADMMWRLNVPEEKFRRAFQKNAVPLSLPERFTVGESDAFLGRYQEGSFSLCRRKKGRFALLSCTLYGKTMKKQGQTVISLRFSRPRGVGILWLLWVLAHLLAGFELLFSETLFALCFLVPGILFSLPLFLFSKKEKTSLLEKLKEFGAEE